MAIGVITVDCFVSFTGYYSTVSLKGHFIRDVSVVIPREDIAGTEAAARLIITNMSDK
jgi:hypothetical protein